MTEYSNVLASAMGAIIGFVLAEIFSLVKLIRMWWTRPRLVIDVGHDNCQILSHGVPTGSGEMYDEKIFGFQIRNAGRRIATGVKAQLSKLSMRKPPGMSIWIYLSMLTLSHYTEAQMSNLKILKPLWCQELQ